jgi:hypothetical protein
MTSGPPPLLLPNSTRAGVLDRPAQRNALTRRNAFRQETQHARRLLCLARTIRGIARPIGEVFFALEKIASSAEDAAENILSSFGSYNFPPDLPALSPELQPRINHAKRK